MGKITPQQYAEILFGDCCFNPAQKRDYLAQRYEGRKYLDELKPHELSRVIEDLLARKNGTEPEEVDEDQSLLTEVTFGQMKHQKDWQ